jgi:type VI secretion system VasD/TssJ family lipoprotein
MNNLQNTFLCKTKLILLLLILGFPFYSGCSSSLKALSIHIHGMSDLNSGGNAVVVHIYELNNDKGFLQASVESFWETGDVPFQKEVIKMTEKKLYPGDTVDLNIVLGPDIRFIGIAANFFDPDRENWRRLYSVEANNAESISVVVGYNSIEIR